MSSQFDPLSAQLINAQKRGTLTDTGYNAALAALNQKRAAATSQVIRLGQTILGTDRSGINDIITGAKNTAAGLNLGQTFDPSSYDTQAKTLAGTDLSNFGGALTNAVGGTQYATLSDLLNAGGSVQGANNPSAINPTGTLAATSPFAPDPNVLANQKRGLGNHRCLLMADHRIEPLSLIHVSRSGHTDPWLLRRHECTGWHTTTEHGLASRS